MEWDTILIITIIILILLLFLIVYIINKNNEIIVPIITTTLPQDNNLVIFEKPKDAVTDRWYNPSIFEYDNQIYYTHRVHIGTNKSGIDYILGDFKSKIIITKETHVWNIVIPNTFKAINGFEDARPIVYKNKLYLIVNEIDQNTKYSFIFILIFKCKDLQINNNKISPTQILKCTYTHDKIRTQKNWIPFFYQQQMYMIYSFNPLTILQINLKSGITNLYSSKKHNIPKSLRGSSNIIHYNGLKYNNCFLTVAHTKYKCIYTNNFVLLNNEPPFDIIGISDEFTMEKNKLLIVNDTKRKLYNTIGFVNPIIQFVAGLLQTQNNLIITYGQTDYYSCQFVISVDDMESLIKPVHTN
jgi:predicted GH43/DUF377 family glycosyl hydrolase